MKKLVVIVLALFIALSFSYAGTIAPANIVSAFNTKFPDATKVKWDKENAHEYEAEFMWKGGKCSANYNYKGEWLETESSITFEQLPEIIQQAFYKSHKNEKIKAVAKIENSKGETKYEIELKKGKKSVELFYSEDGKEINS